MSKAERYIELVSDENGYLCDQHALRAVEIAKEEMMAKAIDAELYSDGMLTPLIKVKDKEKISNIKFGDKVKLIIIKEDKMNKEEFERLAKPLNE